MVFSGQYLERPTLVQLGRVVLEGLSHRGKLAPAVLIVPPTPAEGGSMDHVLAAEVAWACAMAGHPTLRFNFRGVGASQGERGAGDDLVADAKAALGLLEANVAGSSAAGPVAVVTLGAAFEVGVALARFSRLAGLYAVAPRELPQVSKAVVNWLQTLPRDAESL